MSIWRIRCLCVCPSRIGVRILSEKNRSPASMNSQCEERGGRAVSSSAQPKFVIWAICPAHWSRSALTELGSVCIGQSYTLGKTWTFDFVLDQSLKAVALTSDSERVREKRLQAADGRWPALHHSCARETFKSLLIVDGYLVVDKHHSKIQQGTLKMVHRHGSLSHGPFLRNVPTLTMKNCKTACNWHFIRYLCFSEYIAHIILLLILFSFLFSHFGNTLTKLSTSLPKLRIPIAFCNQPVLRTDSQNQRISTMIL